MTIPGIEEQAAMTLRGLVHKELQCSRHGSAPAILIPPEAFHPLLPGPVLPGHLCVQGSKGPSCPRITSALHDPASSQDQIQKAELGIPLLVLTRSGIKPPVSNIWQKTVAENLTNAIVNGAITECTLDQCYSQGFVDELSLFPPLDKYSTG